MIFVTVGTHEQQFNRLLQHIDNLRENGDITEPVIMQTGFSTYNPQYCESYNIIPYSKLLEYVKEARIVISHGGPASFLLPLQFGKIPIVVPRQLEFNEHINNHQVDFTKKVAERFNNIIPIYNINEIDHAIYKYEDIVNGMTTTKTISNNKKFNDNLESIVDDLFSNERF